MSLEPPSSFDSAILLAVDSNGDEPKSPAPDLHAATFADTCSDTCSETGSDTDSEAGDETGEPSLPMESAAEAVLYSHILYEILPHFSPSAFGQLAGVNKVLYNQLRHDAAEKAFVAGYRRQLMANYQSFYRAKIKQIDAVLSQEVARSQHLAQPLMTELARKRILLSLYNSHQFLLHSDCSPAEQLKIYSCFYRAFFTWMTQRESTLSESMEDFDATTGHQVAADGLNALPAALPAPSTLDKVIKEYVLQPVHELLAYQMTLQFCLNDYKDLKSYNQLQQWLQEDSSYSFKWWMLLAYCYCKKSITCLTEGLYELGEFLSAIFIGLTFISFTGECLWFAALLIQYIAEQMVWLYLVNLFAHLAMYSALTFIFTAILMFPLMILIGGLILTAVSIETLDELFEWCLPTSLVFSWLGMSEHHLQAGVDTAAACFSIHEQPSFFSYPLHHTWTKPLAPSENDEAEVGIACKLTQ